MERNERKDGGRKALPLRVAVIEQRYKGFIPEPKDADWHVYETLEGEQSEADMALRCAARAERHTGREFRWRRATLTFDGDGSKCTIY